MNEYLIAKYIYIFKYNSNSYYNRNNNFNFVNKEKKIILLGIKLKMFDI